MNLFRSRWRRALGGVATVALAASLSACGGGDSSAGGAGCETRVLFVGNLTGAGASNGQMGSAGVQAAADYVNANGGVNGCKIVLDIKDDASDYTKDLPIVQQALSTQKYAVVINNDYGGPSIAPYLARQNQLGVLATGADNVVNDPKKTPYLFDTVLPAGNPARVLARHVLGTGAHKIAIVVDDAAYGQGVLDQVTDEVTKGGGQVTSERVNLDTVNMTPVVQRLRAGAPDAIIFNLFGPSVGHFVSDLDASGWRVPLFGSDAVMATDLAGLVPESVINNVGLVLAGPAVNTLPSVTPAVDDLIKTMASKNQINGAITLAAQPHDALIDFAWAANSAKSTDADKVSKWLEEHGNVPVPGLTYTAAGTNYSAANHEWLPNQSIAIVPAGKMVNGQYQGQRIGGLYNAK